MKPNYYSSALLLLLLPWQGQAQTNYYVSLSGDDNRAGTTLQTAWRHIQHAADVATAGNTVNITAGTYNELVTLNVNGTANNPITFKNYQRDVVTISGTGFSANYSGLISIVSKSNIIVDGLILENLTTPFARGVLVLSNPGSGLENIILRNLKIRNIRYTANPGPVVMPTDNAHGIVVYGQGTTTNAAIRNVRVENCEVYNNLNGRSENITFSGNVDGYAVLNNTVHDNTNIGISTAGNQGASSNVTLDHARNGTVAGNVTYNNLSAGTNAGIYCDGCQNTIIERNTTHHNPVGISIGCEQSGTADNVTVRDNVVYQNSFAGIAFGGYDAAAGVVQNSTISNNTCYYNGSFQAGQLRLTKTMNCSIFNNLLVSDDNVLFYVENITPQSFTADYNAFYTSAGSSTSAQVTYRGAALSYTAYKTTTGQDVHSLFANPTLVSMSPTAPNLHLQSASPCVNAGNPAYTPTSAEKDIDGQNRANGRVDIGADEYYVATATQAPIQADVLTVFPNPATDEITLMLAQSQAEQQVQVYDVMGRLVRQVTVNRSLTLNIADWPAGLYLLRVREQPQSALKLVKR